VVTEGRSVIKLRLSKSTKNAQFSSCCFVYDPSGFHMLVRNRTCAVKDRYQWLRRGVSRPLLLPICRGSRHGVVSTTRHLFECFQGADWRRTIPTRIPKYRSGRMNLAERGRESTPSFTFFEKNFRCRKSVFRAPLAPKTASPAEALFMGLDGRSVILSSAGHPADQDKISLRGRHRFRVPCAIPGTAPRPRMPRGSWRQ